MAYNGTVEVISGLKQKNNGTFPLVHASAVQVDDDDTRLDELLEGMDSNIRQSIDDLIMVQNTQPTSEHNEVWIKSTGNEVQVPTYEEFEDLVENTVHLDEQTLTDAQKTVVRDNIGSASQADVADLKSAFPQYGDFDLLRLENARRTNQTVSGVTFEWNNDRSVCTVNGTNNGTSIVIKPIAGSSTELPFGVVAGNTYRVKVKTTLVDGVVLGFYFYINGTFSSVKYFSVDDNVTVPLDATGMIVFVGLRGGKTAIDAKISDIGLLIKDTASADSLLAVANDVNELKTYANIPRRILNGDDLDVVLDSGNYYYPGPNVAVICAHAPVSAQNLPFCLQVFNAIKNSNDGTIQVLYSYSNMCFYRYKRSAAFTDWEGLPYTSTDIDNIYAIVDDNNRILFSVQADGTVDWSVGIPKPVKERIEAESKRINDIGIAIGEDVDYMYAITDNMQNLLGGITVDGAFNFTNIMFNKKNVSDLQKALEENGIELGGKNQLDWSEAKELKIPEPRCAIINISGIPNWPEKKSDDLHAWFEFWDLQGNYFKKRIIISAQGQGTLRFPKKSASIDICNDEWEGDDTFNLKIGNWVPQDSFHMKAYYTDAFRGVCPVGYKLMDEICKTRGFDKDRTWKRALIPSDLSPWGKSIGGLESYDLAYDSGARGFPDGFPSIVYLNGDFYGLYSFQLKKHRDNMHLIKNDPTNVWLDGHINGDTILGGSIVWTGIDSTFEVRNPKDLYLMNGTKYDADTNIGELIDNTSQYYDLDTDSSKVKKNKRITAQVKEKLIELSQIMPHVRELEEAYLAEQTTENLQALKTYFETKFDVDSVIDYLIFCDVLNNTDAYKQNWQWTTHDGIKWTLNIYDTDCVMGQREFWPESIGFVPANRRADAKANYVPTRYAILYYADEMNARYKMLRDKKIIDPEHIIDMLNSWCLRYGIEAYEQEFTKWSECNVHGNSVLNDEWELVSYADTGIVTYNKNIQYNEGDTCVDSANDEANNMGYYTFRAKETVRGVPPVKQWRMNLSLFNVYKWLIGNIARTDEMYHYSDD